MDRLEKVYLFVLGALLYRQKEYAWMLLCYIPVFKNAQLAFLEWQRDAAVRKLEEINRKIQELKKS